MQFSYSDTLSNNTQSLTPQEGNRIKLYVCGITPYDYAHVGHGRCYITYDCLVRTLTLLGYDVRYCRNVTDVDDKLINRAREERGDARAYKELADFYFGKFCEDMAALNCLEPSVQPRVTGSIQQIITLVQRLISQGHAYVADGDVYYDVESFPTYGKLSKRSLDDLMVGARVAPSEKKRNPLDFALWKSANENAGDVGWESPWGFGRPGWHIECSAMAAEELGTTLDLHAGGMDLIFPHHENEIAQSEGASGKPLAQGWMHNAFVRINQEKMSKSTGNFFTLRQVFEKVDPMLVRYVIVTHHYRTPLDFSFEACVMAEKSYQRLARSLGSTSIEKVTLADIKSDPVTHRMLEFLCDDLNTPGMFGVVFEHLETLAQDPARAARVAFLLKNLCGLTLQPLPEKVQAITPEIQALIDERESARAARDYQKADALRDQLKQLGYEIKDTKKSSPA